MLTRRQLMQRLGGSAAMASWNAFSGPEGALAQTVAKAKPLNLKITDVRVFNVAPRSTFVKLYTNQGLIGLGEAHQSGLEEAVSASILLCKPLLIGKDPTAIEGIWEEIYEGPRWRGGPFQAALSAIDIAQWDILGQALGQPIFKLLGGPVRERIRCYDAGGGVTPESWEKTKANGFTASRVQWPRGNSITEMIEQVHALRKACGPSHELALHGSGSMPTSDVIQFMRGIEDCNLMWVEEPLQMDDIEDWALLRSHTSTPIATGERVLTTDGFNPYLTRHLIDFAQPDIGATGGILEARKIAAIAEANRIRMAPHGPQRPPGAFANFHFDAATPNFYVQEIREYSDQEDLDLHEGLVPQIRNGFCELPDRPGLGTVLNEKVASRLGPPNFGVPSGLGLRSGLSPRDLAILKAGQPARGGASGARRPRGN